MQIAEIASHTELAPVLARWHVAEWRHLYENWDEDAATRELAAMVEPGRIPTTWIAFRGEGRTASDVIGSVSLLADDGLTGFEHLGPWLANLYVVPGERGHGLGRALVRHVMGHAHACGVGHLYLFTENEDAFYLQLGWSVVARPLLRGVPVAVMTVETAIGARTLT
jgi:GNAT superfamily N-acetyltransferase